ncbi:peptidylprolyl isomerase [Candidatus Woesearchaeota archaeon]|nr:peptidylprolyl isomerase [Candidatus Woesearchaeota archaeon]
MAKKNNRSKSKSKKSLKKSKFGKTIAILVLLVIIVVLAVFGSMKLLAIKKAHNVAVVNDVKITAEELDKHYNFIFFIMGYPEEYKQIITKDAILEQLINEKLLLEEAAKQGIDVDNEDVDKRIKEMLNQNLLTEEQFKDRLSEGGFSFDDFENYFKNQLVMSEFLNETLFSEIEISDSEIEEYYEKNKESYIAKEEQIRARHILIETEEEAQDILKELRKGVDFAELAEERSIGPSSARGGDLGFFSKGTMVKEFEDAVFDLRIGGISDPIKTDFGWHVIKRESDIISFEEAKESIKNILLVEKQKKAFENYLTKLKANSEILIDYGNGLELMETEFEESIEDEDIEEEDVEDTCIGNYGVSKDTIIFYHANWCSYCNSMKSVVEDLEEEGYKFFWAETSKEEGMIVRECFNDVLQGGIPEFICAGTYAYKIGAMSKTTLRDFAERCRN